MAPIIAMDAAMPISRIKTLAGCTGLRKETPNLTDFDYFVRIRLALRSRQVDWSGPVRREAMRGFTSLENPPGRRLQHPVPGAC